jgi:TonB family protein
LVVSLVTHGLIAVALGALGVVPRPLDVQTESFVELEMLAPPAPEPTPEPAVTATPPEPTPAPVAEPPRLRPERAPEPPPEQAAPPSVDEVFGEPAPAAPILTAEGAGSGPAMDPGVLDGVPGGRGGGTGEGLGEGGGGGTGEGLGVGGGSATPAGPTEADRRRARRAYVRSLEGLLNGRIRYPRAAARDRLEGRAEICFRIGADGRVLDTRMCGSTGHGLLDEAALEAAGALDRVPAPPALAAWAPEDEIHAGVVFVIR